MESWTRVELEGCSRDKLRSRALDLRDALGWSDRDAPLPSTIPALITWILQAQDRRNSAPSDESPLDGNEEFLASASVDELSAVRMLLRAGQQHVFDGWPPAGMLSRP